MIAWEQNIWYYSSGKQVNFMIRKLISLVLTVLMLLSWACAEGDVVPFGRELRFETQVTSAGVARLHGEEDFETLSFTIRMTGNRGPVHFKKYYEDGFALKGSEAVAEFELTLEDYAGDAQINPNRVILFTLQAENGGGASGYRLMDWEMGGSDDIALVPGKKVKLFKRYDFDEEDENPMCYLAVHTFNDGVEQIFRMDMRDPGGENSFYVVYDELKRKSRGKAVVALQQKLQELGLLSGSSVDGVYGPGTAESVKAAQQLLGFEETGIATHEFQKALYKYIPEDTQSE